jgi:hypothetical protein
MNDERDTSALKTLSAVGSVRRTDLGRFLMLQRIGIAQAMLAVRLIFAQQGKLLIRQAQRSSVRG